MHRVKAFTLIEVMVVVIIIGILASVSILGYTSIQQNARDNSRFAKATVIAEALEKYYNNNKEYPSVAALNGQTIASLKQKLSIQDGDVLVFPSGTPNTSAIGVGTPTQTKLVYTGTTQDPNANAQCQSVSTGYCDSFELKYKKETDNTDVTIKSRQTVATAPECTTNCVSAPTRPSVVGSAVGTSAVRFTASGSTCVAGSVEYKIRYNTTSANSMPDWSTVSWSSNPVKDIPYPATSTTYYSQSLARCNMGGGTYSPESAESEVHTFAPNVPCSAPPGQPGWTNLSYTPQGNGTQYKATMDWWGSSNPGNCLTLRYKITHVGGGNINDAANGNISCGGTTGITANACTVTFINQGTFGEFWITPENEYGVGPARYMNGWARPTISTVDLNITYRDDVQSAQYGLGFPITVNNSATTNGNRWYYVASDNNTHVACAPILVWTNANGNGSAMCQNPDFGKQPAGQVCRNNRNFFIVDQYYGFTSPAYNNAWGVWPEAPGITLNNAFKQNGYLKLRWSHSGPITYVQMRYQLFNPNTGQWGGHQSIDNINENADDPNGYTIGPYASGWKVQAWLFAANCNHKVDNNSLTSSAPYWWPNNVYTGEFTF